jgi:hypothetical protein
LAAMEERWACNQAAGREVLERGGDACWKVNATITLCSGGEWACMMSRSEAEGRKVELPCCFQSRYLSRRAMCLPCLALPAGSTHMRPTASTVPYNATTAGGQVDRQAGRGKGKAIVYTLVHGHLTYLSAEPYLTRSPDVSTPLIRSKPMSSSHAVHAVYRQTFHQPVTPHRSASSCLSLNREPLEASSCNHAWHY